LIAQGKNIDPSGLRYAQSQFCYESPKIHFAQIGEDIGWDCIMYTGRIEAGKISSKIRGVVLNSSYANPLRRVP